MFWWNDPGGSKIEPRLPFKIFSTLHARVGRISNYDDYGKVENILKGSLDLIPTPSPLVKIQVMDRKVCLRCKGKTFEYKKFVDITQ